MVEDDLPPRVIDLVRMFLAASSRGEQAVLVLETKKKMLTTKYRSVESVAGVPATSCTKKEKVNPARARRSKLRLEQFNKKIEEKKKQEYLDARKQEDETEATGDTSCNKLLLKLARAEDRPVMPGLLSPIVQVDGTDETDENEEAVLRAELRTSSTPLRNSLSSLK